MEIEGSTPILSYCSETSFGWVFLDSFIEKMRVNLRYKGQYIQVRLNVKELVVIGLGVGSAFVVDKLWGDFHRQAPSQGGKNRIFKHVLCKFFFSDIVIIVSGGYESITSLS